MHTFAWLRQADGKCRKGQTDYLMSEYMSSELRYGAILLLSAGDRDANTPSNEFAVEINKDFMVVHVALIVFDFR